MILVICGKIYVRPGVCGQKRGVGSCEAGGCIYRSGKIRLNVGCFSEKGSGVQSEEWYGVVESKVELLRRWVMFEGLS